MSSSEDEQPLLRHQRCRTCLSKLGTHNIFTTNSVQMLTYLMNMEFENSDNLPAGLCDECLWGLKQAYTFKKKCEMTHTILIQEQQLDEQLNCLQPPAEMLEDEKETEEMESELGNENDQWIQFQQNSLFLNERFEENNQTPLPSEILHIRLEQLESDSENTNIPDGCHNCSDYLTTVHEVTQMDMFKLVQNYGFNQKFPILMSCSVCNKKISKPHILKKHIENPNAFTCEFCGLPFRSSNDLDKHISLSHIFTCDSFACDSDNNDDRIKNLEIDLTIEEDETAILKKRLKTPVTKSSLTDNDNELKIIIIDDPDEEEGSNT